MSAWIRNVSHALLGRAQRQQQYATRMLGVWGGGHSHHTYGYHARTRTVLQCQLTVVRSQSPLLRPAPIPYGIRCTTCVQYSSIYVRQIYRTSTGRPPVTRFPLSRGSPARERRTTRSCCRPPPHTHCWCRAVRPRSRSGQHTAMCKAFAHNRGHKRVHVQQAGVWC